MMLPVVEELAAEYEGKIIVGKLNVDENDETCGTYGIMNIPTILFFKNGELVYELPTLDAIRKHCQEEKEGMWEEVRRFTNPHNYYVDLSRKLWDVKHELLNKRSK